MEQIKLDILAFAAHPDDTELACCGTLLKHIAMGKRVGVIDLTRGELGTRGSADIRDKEAADAAKILGLSVRENLRFADGFFSINQAHFLPIIQVIRKYQPEIVLANAVSDRHPDHGRAGKLVSEACFLSGLTKIETALVDGNLQQAWRPKTVYHYIQDRYMKPDFSVDITPYMETKMSAIKAFASQFHDPDSNEPITTISTPEFLDFVKARAIQYGREIGVKYAEGFTVERTMGINNLFDLL